jgi:hypothetical protein
MFVVTTVKIIIGSLLSSSFLLTSTGPVVVQAAPLNDIIHELPLWGRPPTPQFSGYLNATEGCDPANGPICKLHYWLSLAEDNDEGPGLSKPVVLWLNGGPGSSSILGYLQEVGPVSCVVHLGFDFDFLTHNFFVVYLAFDQCDGWVDEQSVGMDTDRQPPDPGGTDWGRIFLLLATTGRQGL